MYVYIYIYIWPFYIHTPVKHVVALFKSQQLLLQQRVTYLYTIKVNGIYFKVAFILSNDDVKTN